MIAFSARFKDAFKLALAMLIAYAIALSQGWGTPFWAGFAVVFCGLTAVGDSLNKGLLRVFGTLFGAVAGLALLGLFPQDRWAFLIAMTLFIVFCSYMMGRTTRWYFWFMAGITVPIVAVTAEPNSLYDFNRAVLRTQQTTLGIVVYTLVSVLIWPTSSRSDFEGAVRTLLGNQRKLFTRYMTQLTGGSGDPLGEDGAAQLRGEVTRALGGLHTRLDHAELDTYEIWEVRRAWRGSVAQLDAMNRSMEALRQTFHELSGIDAQRYIRSLPALGAELDARLAAIEGMLDGQAPAHQPVDLACEPDRERLAELSHFDQSAVLLAISQLTQLERETRALFDAIRYIRGFGSAHDAGPVADVPAARAALDPDWLIGVLRVVVVLWLNLLLYIYVPDLPAASALVIVGNVFAMLMLLHPQMRPFVLFWPMAFGTLVGAVAHVLVMPHLSGYLELGTMLFVFVFGLVYLLYSPRRILYRFCGLAFFMVLVSIDEPQHFSVLTALNLSLVFPMILGGLVLTMYLPVSLRAEDRFQAILGRFFRSSAFLMATTGWSRDRAPSRLQRWRKAFHLNEVASAPQRLGTWTRSLPAAALGTTSQAQVQDLVTSVQALSDRMKTLMQARAAHQSDAIVRELREDVHSWRIGVQAIFARLASAPEAADFTDYRSRLDAKLERLEARIAEVLERADEHGLSIEEGENMHRLLGAHRGVSEALVGLATQTAVIEWPRLREARF
jgi:uncharacterized membrane protein YccC